MKHTIEIPDWVTTPGDLADHLRIEAPSPLDEIGAQIADIIDEHAQAVGDMGEVRAVLTDFGAVAPDDRTTPLVDLLRVFLPPMVKS